MGHLQKLSAGEALQGAFEDRQEAQNFLVSASFSTFLLLLWYTKPASGKSQWDLETGPAPSLEPAV